MVVEEEPEYKPGDALITIVVEGERSVCTVGVGEHADDDVTWISAVKHGCDWMLDSYKEISQAATIWEISAR